MVVDMKSKLIGVPMAIACVEVVGSFVAGVTASVLIHVAEELAIGMDILSDISPHAPVVWPGCYHSEYLEDIRFATLENS